MDGFQSVGHNGRQAHPPTWSALTTASHGLTTIQAPSNPDDLGPIDVDRDVLRNKPVVPVFLTIASTV
jgi:hypothetical protein